MDTSDIELKLKWRLTWDDRENDFVAEAPEYEGTVGRIHRCLGGPRDGQWAWSMVAHVGKTWFSDRGVEPTPREAAREVEKLWFDKALPLAGPKKVNPYARAKGA